VLNAVYENDFVGISYGFRPGRSQHDALDAVAVAIEKRKINWVVDADFRKFFDTIDRRWLQHLHFVFDLWALQWRRRTAQGDMVMVRYADDTFLGFEHREEAERFLVELRERVAQFGLSLHPEKTRLIAFGRHANAWCRRQGQRRAQTFDFLGFTHICGLTRGKGWFQLRRVTMAKRMHAKLAEIKQQLRRRLHGQMREVGTWLLKVLQGFYNYHAVPGNLRRLWSMRYRLLHAWWRILGRRSQLRMSWDRYFSRVRTWLPEPRVLHPYPDARFRATHSR
jgi:RNA-directed DNA polymerase